MRPSEVTALDLRQELQDWQERFPRLREDEIFVAWFLRAFVVEDEHEAVKSLTGGSGDGSAFPSADYGLGSESAIFGLWGPGVRRGYVRPHPIRLVDVTPTVCHLLGISPPAQSEGAVPADVIRR